jgi:hypothetical protein
MTPLQLSRLKEVLDYNPDNGAFTWIQSSRGTGIGDTAGTVTDSGYLIISVDKKRYRAHRLAWLYMTGRFPETDIDHINGNRLDNRFDNLREVTRSENLQNRNKPNASSGIIGVYRHRNKYTSRIGIDKTKSIYLGVFSTAEEARNAYLKAKKKYHPSAPINEEK